MIDKNSVTFQYLRRSALVVLAVCILVFGLLLGYYEVRSEAAVSDVSQIYMSKINERLKAHFETAVSYCLSRLESVVAKAAPETVKTFEQADEELTNAALPEGFSAVSLMGPSGELDSLYGGNITVLYAEHTLSILEQGFSYVGIGILDGRQVELCCAPAHYPMRSGKESTAVIGALSDDFLNDILTLDVPGGMVSSFIIRADGSYVLRDEGYGANYYTDTVDEDSSRDRSDVEHYVEKLAAALNEAEPYEGSFKRNGSTVQVLATPLAYSQWYLITELSEGDLTEAVSALGSETGWIVIVGFIVLLACLITVFAGYYKLTKEQREKLEMAQAEAVRANKAKSEFFSNMSHDIRTPMNAIAGMTDIALKRLGNPAAVRDALEKIKVSSKQLLGLINDVLDMSRIESGKLTLHPDLMSLSEFTSEIVAIIQPQVEGKRQKFDVFVDNVTVENVNCDAIRLNQILLNLLGNAVKFTPEGGTITLAISEAPSNRGDEYIRLIIEVCDTGTGMSKEFQEKVFESFAREEGNATVKSTEGAGLGMAITKHIIERMNGSIGVDSAPGEGTTFHVEIDAEKAPVPEIDMKLPPMRVLVIDDDAQMGDATVQTLKSLGAHAESALDGESGLKRVHEADDDGKPFDFVLTDWKLPYMNGVQTARRIREAVGDKPIILMTSAYDWADAEDEARNAGIDGFLPKPLFKSTLYFGLLGVIDGSEEAAVEDDRPDFKGKRLLVAEDNDLNWEVIEVLLTDVNFAVEHALNGQEAVTKFSLSPPGYYDAILMDVQMPIMNGHEATRQIRQMRETRRDADLPIIAMTAEAFADDKRRALEAGMNAHVTKPIDVNDLIRTLARFVRKKP